MPNIYNDEDNVAMNERDIPVRELCRDRCNMARYCYKTPCYRDDFPDECGEYYHLEDIVADARDILEEQKRAMNGDDGEYFFDEEDEEEDEDGEV